MKAGQPKPEGYSRGETDFRRLCQQEDLDLVLTATPWEWHVPVCLAAMNNGKHAATEVPAAVTLEECWQLVETAEKTGRHCVMTGELLLRPHGTDDPEHGPARACLGELHPRRMRLPARPARAEVRATRARDCGGSPMPSSATAISIRRTGWGPSRSA